MTEKEYSKSIQCLVSSKEVLRNAINFYIKNGKVEIKMDLTLNGINFGTLKLTNNMLISLLQNVEARKEELIFARSRGYIWNIYLRNI